VALEMRRCVLIFGEWVLLSGRNAEAGALIFGEWVLLSGRNAEEGALIFGEWADTAGDKVTKRACGGTRSAAYVVAASRLAKKSRVALCA
jgi:hypothetical protein